MLYWSQQYWPSIGGVEVLAAAFIHGMRRRGFEFTVVTSQGSHPLPNEECHDGVAIHRLPFARALRRAATSTPSSTPREPRRAQAPGEAGARPPSALRSQCAVPPAHPSRLIPHRPRIAACGAAGAAGRESSCSPSCCRRRLDHGPLARRGRRHRGVAVRRWQARMTVIHPRCPWPTRPPAPLPHAPPVLLCLGPGGRRQGVRLALESLPGILVEFPDTRLVIAGDGAARRELERPGGEARDRGGRRVRRLGCPERRPGADRPRHARSGAVALARGLRHRRPAGGADGAPGGLHGYRRAAGGRRSRAHRTHRSASRIPRPSRAAASATAAPPGRRAALGVQARRRAARALQLGPSARRLRGAVSASRARSGGDRGSA